MRNRSIYRGVKPPLRVSESKKNGEYTKDVMDSCIESSYFRDSKSNTGYNRDLYVFYDAYNNIIPESYFNYVTNPLNSSKTEYKSYPARIRSLSIIRTNVDLFIGEYEKRPKNYTIKVHGSGNLNQAQDQLYGSVLQNLEQMFVNNLNEMGQETNVESQEIPTPQEIVNKSLSNYKDERAIWADVCLREVEDDQYTDETYKRLFKDFVIAGEMYTYKTVRADQVIYERVSAFDIDYEKSPDLEYTEDASWVVRRQYLTATDIIARWPEAFKAKDVDLLETVDQSNAYGSSYLNSLFGRTDNEEDLKRNKIACFHIVFYYYKKMNFLTFNDPELNMPVEIEVPENYKPGEGETMETIWVPDQWEGWRIDLPTASGDATERGDSKTRGSDDDDPDTFYVDMRRVPYQRTKINNFSYTKLPYNGIRFSDVHTRNISIVELGIPYQVLYQILHYRLELTIAKSKGKIILMDINTIPNSKGWTPEKFMYWADANSFAFVDRSQPNVDKQWNQYQVLDMDLFQHIKNLIDIISFVKSEWDQLIGITPQRKGQVQASETASGIDAARYQSSVISEQVFGSMDEFVQRERQGLLDLTKFTNKEEKRTIHKGDDMKSVMLTMDPEMYAEAEYGVYVNNSSEELRTLELLKGNLTAFASQGGRASSVIEIAEAQSISKLKSLLKEAEAEEQAMAQKMEQDQGKQEERMIEIEKAYKSMEVQLETQAMRAEYEEKKDIEHIKGQYNLADTDTPGDSLDPVGLEKNLIDVEKVRNDKELKDKEINQKEAQSKRDDDTKRYVADQQLKIAKENKTDAEVKAKKK